MCRVFTEKSSITGNKVGKICVKRPILRPGSMSRYTVLSAYQEKLKEQGHRSILITNKQAKNRHLREPGLPASHPCQEI